MVQFGVTAACQTLITSPAQKSNVVIGYVFSHKQLNWYYCSDGRKLQQCNKCSSLKHMRNNKPEKIVNLLRGHDKEDKVFCIESQNCRIDCKYLIPISYSNSLQTRTSTSVSLESIGFVSFSFVVVITEEECIVFQVRLACRILVCRLRILQTFFNA